MSIDDPWKSVAKSLNETCEKLEDAPPDKSGEGWEGHVGGFCPVQGEGTVDGLNWYFRARHASGKTLVLLTADGAAVWGVIENMDPAGGLRWRCSIFRNEGPHRSSDLIREATDRSYVYWRRRHGGLPGVPLTTEVDPEKTKRKRALARGARQMVFDWHKAARLIRERKPGRAGAGLHADWEWTGGDIYRDGAPVPRGETYTYLSSNHCTPEIEIDGELLMSCVCEGDPPEDWGPYKPKVEVRAPRGGELRTSWSATREGDRARFVETGHKGTVKIYPGGPVIQWDDTGELEPDIAFTLVGSGQTGGADSK